MEEREGWRGDAEVDAHGRGSGGKRSPGGEEGLRR